MITTALIIIAWTAGLPLWASVTVTVIAGVRVGIKGLRATVKIFHAYESDMEKRGRTE